MEPDDPTAQLPVINGELREFTDLLRPLLLEALKQDHPPQGADDAA